MFRPQIKVISTVKEHCLGVVIKDIFQDILAMDILKNSDGSVSLINLSNIIKVRSIVPPVAHLMKIMK